MNRILALLAIVVFAAIWQRPELASFRLPILESPRAPGESERALETGITPELDLPPAIEASEASEDIPWLIVVGLVAGLGWALFPLGWGAVLIGGGIVAAHPLLSVALAAGESQRLFCLMLAVLSAGAFLRARPTWFVLGSLVAIAALVLGRGSPLIFVLVGLSSVIGWCGMVGPRRAPLILALLVVILGAISAFLEFPEVGFRGPSNLVGAPSGGDRMASFANAVGGEAPLLSWLPSTTLSFENVSPGGFGVLGLVLVLVMGGRMGSRRPDIRGLIWFGPVIFAMSVLTLMTTSALPSSSFALPAVLALAVSAGAFAGSLSRRSLSLGAAGLAIIYLSVQSLEQVDIQSDAVSLLAGFDRDPDAVYAARGQLRHRGEIDEEEHSLGLYRDFVAEDGRFARAWAPAIRARVASDILDSLVKARQFEAIETSARLIEDHGASENANAGEALILVDDLRRADEIWNEDPVSRPIAETIDEILAQPQTHAHRAQAVAAKLLLDLRAEESRLAPSLPDESASGYDRVYRLFKIAEQRGRLDPRSAQPLVELGRHFIREDDPIRALNVFEWAIEADPADPEPYAELGALYATQGEAEEARRYLERGLGAEGIHPKARFPLARLLFDLPQAREEGLREMALALGDHPDDFANRRILAECQSLYAELCLAQGGEEDALRWAEKARANHDEVSRAHWVIGRIASQNGDFNGAFQAYWRAIQLGDKRDNLITDAVDVGKRWGYHQLISLDDRDGAFQTFEKLLSLDAPAEDLESIRVIVEGAKSRSDEAIGKAGSEGRNETLTPEEKQARQRRTNEARSAYEEGMRCLAEGDQKQARELFQESLERLPGNPYPYWQLGRLDRDDGELAASIDNLRRAAALADELRMPLPTIHYELADVLDRAGSRDAAEDLWKQCLERWPEAAEAPDAAKRLYGGKRH